MEYRELKQLGIETSLLGFGCMRFPTHQDGTIHEEEAEKMVDLAIAQGVNYIDTAYPYHNGESEPFVGRVLDKYERKNYYLATKLPCWEVNTFEDAKRLFEKQLNRLHKDYIDFYLLHALNKERFRKMVDLGVLEYCEQLKAEGKIKYFGFSFHDDYEAFEEIIQYRSWDFCQIQLNYMDTEEQAGMKGYELAKSLDIPVVIMEPIKGGSLANLPEDITNQLRSVCPDQSTASWAMRWVGSLSNVKVILSGMSTMEQVEDNLKTFQKFIPLGELESNTIEAVADILKNRVNNGCTGCNYCMPCPVGVNIPRNFRIWNQHGIYENVNSTVWNWKNMNENEKANQCVECGKCEEECPQKISIRADLKKLHSELEQLDYV